MEKPKAILFAGPIGCSKSVVAIYLSWNLSFPIFSKDIIRNEIREDLGKLDKNKVDGIYEYRMASLIEKNANFILDTSIDRKADETLSQLTNYDIFVISFDISKNFLMKLWEYKGYELEEKVFDRNYREHLDFLDKYNNIVDLSIGDENFAERLELSLTVANKWFTGYSSDG